MFDPTDTIYNIFQHIFFPDEPHESHDLMSNLRNYQYTVYKMIYLIFFDYFHTRLEISYIKFLTQYITLQPSCRMKEKLF